MIRDNMFARGGDHPGYTIHYCLFSSGKGVCYNVFRLMNSVYCKC